MLYQKRCFKSVQALVILGLMMFLSGCGDYQSNVEAGNLNGTLHWGNGTEPQSLDPHIATGVPEHHIISALMEGLIHKDGETLEPRPGVAESWDISDDGRIYTFYYAKMLDGQMAIPTMPMIIFGLGGEHCNQRLATSMPICIFLSKMPKPIMKVKLSDFDQVGVKALDALSPASHSYQPHSLFFAVTGSLQYLSCSPRYRREIWQSRSTWNALDL